MEFLLVMVIFFFALTIHEYAHGWIAYKKGDPTAFYSGRLTLNPLAHIDPVGTVIFPIVLLIMTQGKFTFGWAKPVPINYQALNNPKKDILWVGLAGPLANIAFALVLSLLVRMLGYGTFLHQIITTGIFINLLFAVFNLIPIPPLDGSRVVMGLLPPDLAYEYSKLEQFGFIILILLLVLGLIHKIVLPIVIGIARLMGVGL